jgi:acetolactate synthase-1/2/3 large subunit
MTSSKKRSVDRRGFLKGAAAGATALVAKPEAVKAQQADPRRAGAPSPGAKEIAAETSAPAKVEVQTTERPGSDFMVDVIKTLGFEYVCSNPGSSFRGLHESVINYGGNRSPEFITCCHEESATAMAHGYAKIEGKPLLVFAHGTVGLQHASMAIYNAYCDRVPVYVMLGNIMDATRRRSFVDWAHSVQGSRAE